MAICAKIQAKQSSFSLARTSITSISRYSKSRNSLIGDDEEIYVEQPHGFEVTEVNGKKGKYVCKLKKGLYGLKQSPRSRSMSKRYERG